MRLAKYNFASNGVPKYNLGTRKRENERFALRNRSATRSLYGAAVLECGTPVPLWIFHHPLCSFLPPMMRHFFDDIS